MREILFRGKRTDNGEWVQGYPCRYGWTGKEKDYIIPDYASALYTAEIDPETIGQYTGLTDKNGKKVFEGDIVKCRDIYNDIEFTAVVEFGNPNRAYNWGWQLRIIDGDEYINPDILLWVDMEDTGAICEVIGTVRDNPELLKAGEMP